MKNVCLDKLCKCEINIFPRKEDSIFFENFVLTLIMINLKCRRKWLQQSYLSYATNYSFNRMIRKSICWKLKIVNNVFRCNKHFVILHARHIWRCHFLFSYDWFVVHIYTHFYLKAKHRSYTTRACAKIHVSIG